MDQLLDITRALSDESRLRAVMALRDGELCLCQLIELLGLAPSTVSRHMKLLTRAGLITQRKAGRWHYYRLAGRTAPLAVRRALTLTCDALGDDDVIRQDEPRRAVVVGQDPAALSACCYPS